MVSILMVVLVALTASMAVFAMQSTQSFSHTSNTQQSSRTSSSSSAQSNINQQGDASGSTASKVGGDTSSQQSSSFNESDSISLPSVSVGSEVAGIISNGTDITPSNTTQTLLGIVFWVCIAIGILVIVVVILAAARKPPKGGTGKKRYERRPMTPKGKRILNEKYYRNIKK